RFIMNFPNGIIDHINRNKLDNRKFNLRIATLSQNSSNKKVPKHNTSGFAGVSKTSRGFGWAATICINKRQYFLGYFRDKRDAGRMRALAELRFRKDVM